MREWNKTILCDCTTATDDNLARLRAAVGPLGWRVAACGPSSSKNVERDAIDFESAGGAFDPAVFAVVLHEAGIRQAETSVRVGGDDPLADFVRHREGVGGGRDFAVDLDITFDGQAYTARLGATSKRA